MLVIAKCWMVCPSGAEATWQVCNGWQWKRCENWRNCPAHHCSPVCVNYRCCYQMLSSIGCDSLLLVKSL